MFIVTFHQLNATLLNKSIDIFKKKSYWHVLTYLNVIPSSHQNAIIRTINHLIFSHIAVAAIL